MAFDSLLFYKRELGPSLAIFCLCLKTRSDAMSYLGFIHTKVH